MQAAGQGPPLNATTACMPVCQSLEPSSWVQCYNPRGVPAPGVPRTPPPPWLGHRPPGPGSLQLFR